ncbi:MAG: galactokinase [Desulfobacterales bacterium]|nr:galactokinase [Desulfobacterales bacterium]
MDTNKIRKILESEQIKSSAPCRIDMGGTLDISTFYYPLRHFSPCTFNIALDYRTEVEILPYNKGQIKVSSRGFESFEEPLINAPFKHPVGLIFAICSYFGIDGIHININSSSPPKSGLGGSSVAAVALISCFSKIFQNIGQKALSNDDIVMLAHGIEESVAGVPCGIQDQLAAAYGGVNAWYWTGQIQGDKYKKISPLPDERLKDLESSSLLCYCGTPHESKNINSIWVSQFLLGNDRNSWIKIIEITHKFIEALKLNNYKDAAYFMNKETEIRLNLTPDVLNEAGKKLYFAAKDNICGARFTGAGGGGCIWAIGEKNNIYNLKNDWKIILDSYENACFLDLKIDNKGLNS